jgi:hypothetical protein
MPAATGFEAVRVVSPPAGGFWRVAAWSDPFEPPPPPPAIGEGNPAEDDSGRWDDPDGIFETLYCATEPEGALGEKLGHFAFNPAVVLRIEAFLEGEPDEEYQDDALASGLREEEVEAFEWRLAHAPSMRGPTLIDAWSARTLVAVLPVAAPLLARFGLRALDRRALLDERRNFTRGLAGLLREMATDNGGELLASGLRYESRLPPAWECWALWMPPPLDADDADIEEVTIHTPALRNAASQLGVPLLD